MITFIESGNRIATENFEIGEIYTITFTNGNYKAMCCVGIGSDFVMFQDKLPNALFCLTLGTSETVSTIEIGGGGSGTVNYNELENKPQINGIVLIGNKTASDLNLVSQTDLVNYATNASVTAALASKQDALTTTQLNAVNSGITSTDVTQITTNKNNISTNQTAIAKCSVYTATATANIETHRVSFADLISNAIVAAGISSDTLVTYELSAYATTGNGAFYGYGKYKYNTLHTLTIITNDTITKYAINNFGTVLLGDCAGDITVMVRIFA